MSDTVENENQARFDRLAAEWDANPSRIALARAVVESIRKAVPLRTDMVALDFGAGTGLLTLALSADVADVTALDTSSEMLKKLDEKMNARGITTVHTMPGDIGNMALPQNRFDLIVSSMVLHHIPDVPAALQKLRLCLRSNGWIALADLDVEDGSFHADPTGVFHHGLDPRNVCQWLEEAGFTQARFSEAYRLARPGADGKPREYGIFLVTARGG